MRSISCDIKLLTEISRILKESHPNIDPIELKWWRNFPYFVIRKLLKLLKLLKCPMQPTSFYRFQNKFIFRNSGIPESGIRNPARMKLRRSSRRVNVRFVSTTSWRCVDCPDDLRRNSRNSRNNRNNRNNHNTNCLSF